MKLSLRAKIFFAFGTLVLTLAATTTLSVWEFDTLGDDLRTLQEGHLALARNVGQLETHQQNRFRDLRRARGESGYPNRAVVLRIATAYFPDVIEARILAIEQISRRQLLNPGRRRSGFYGEVLDRATAIRTHHDDLNALTEALLVRAETSSSSRVLDRGVDKKEVELRAEIYSLNQLIDQGTDRMVRRTERTKRAAIGRVLVATGIALVVAVLLFAVTASSLASIRRLVKFARAISRGDYQYPLPRPADQELIVLADAVDRMGSARKEREAELDRQQAELERAYHRVDELKRFHENIVESLRTAITVVDRDHRITSANRAARARFGLQTRAGKTIDASPLGGAVVAAIGPIGDLIEARATRSAQAVPLEGALFDIVVAPLFDEDGRAHGLVVATEDVTDSVKTKEALIRSERLAAIGRMSAHVTHEIRNPLSSIGLNAELLAEAPTSDDTERLAGAINREVDRLTAITDEYLRFARFPQPELKSVDAREIVRSTHDFVRPDCEAASARLVLALPDSPAEVMCDADQIRQALWNLVRNAKEAMPRGGAITLAVDRAGDDVVFIVKDTGPGIPSDQLERILDPFHSTKLTGTGLGLALVQQIAEEHGGSLSVTSEPGLGAEFRVSIPHVQHAETTQESAQAQNEAWDLER